MNTDRIVAQLALSLYASAKRVERLPKVTEYAPHETVALVSVPAELRAANALVSLVSPRFEVL